MDKGELVPDEVTIAMAKDRMEQPDAERGFLLDGFPRNVSQAEALDELLTTEAIKLDAVLDLEAPRRRSSSGSPAGASAATTPPMSSTCRTRSRRRKRL